MPTRRPDRERPHGRDDHVPDPIGAEHGRPAGRQSLLDPCSRMSELVRTHTDDGQCAGVPLEPLRARCRCALVRNLEDVDRRDLEIGLREGLDITGE